MELFAAFAVIRRHGRLSYDRFMRKAFIAASMFGALSAAGCAGFHYTDTPQAPRARYGGDTVIERDILGSGRDARRDADYPVGDGRMDELRDPGRFHDTGQLSW